jgi:hypothetical protein
MRPDGAPSSLEGESGLSCTFGNRFHPPVVDETATVEHDRVNSGRFGTLTDDLTDRACSDALSCLRAGAIDYVLF